MSLYETIETKWKGLLDLKMNEKNDALFGISTGSNGSLVLWETPWDEGPLPVSPANYDTHGYNNNNNQISGTNR